jgi:hypothetical protein
MTSTRGVPALMLAFVMILMLAGVGLVQLLTGGA